MRKSLLIILIPIFGTMISCSSIEIKNSVPSNNAGTLFFSGETKFEDVSRIKPQVVSECEINKYLVHGLIEQSDKNSLPITSRDTPRKLNIEVVNATPGIFVFGNMGSVPATLDIRFTVTENGKVIHQQSRHCKTNLAGFLGLQPSACNKIEKCALNQGRYISERLSRVMYSEPL